MKGHPSTPIGNLLNPEVEEIINTLWRDGFVNGGQVLSYSDIEIVNNEIDQLITDQAHWSERHTEYGAFDYFLPPFADENWTVLSNLAGRSNRLDLILEKLVTHEKIKRVLNASIGEDYKAWELSFRRSHAKDNGLGIHQDARGEFGISVLLRDANDRDGTTSFLPKSHRFRTSCRDAGVNMFIKPRNLKYVTTPGVGKAGDVIFFFKKTWHGRVASQKDFFSDALIFSFYPVGYSFKPFLVPERLHQRLPSELGRLVRIDQGLKKNLDGSHEVIGHKKSLSLTDFLDSKEHRIRSFWDYTTNLKRTADKINRWRHRIAKK